MLSRFGSESLALRAVVSAFLHTPMIDCCTALLQIPKRDILLSRSICCTALLQIPKNILLSRSILNYKRNPSVVSRGNYGKQVEQMKIN